ncbi:hypothetical protein ACP70R_025020 [Stipagrostis hirtigluma subsp. patula]
MEAESSLRFGQEVSSAGSMSSVVNVAQPIPSLIPFPGMVSSALLAGVGMPPAGFAMPVRLPAPTGYGTAPIVPPTAGNGVPMAERPQAGGGNNGFRAPAQQRGGWTPEEDEILKEMVSRHGDRKWAFIAQYLPGRVGKQLRERWTNHLRPQITKNSIWTEEDDLALIEAHKACKNRWALIAQRLPGRSENAVKNHWNATKRSLHAKRRLKKRNSQPQLPPGEFSALEKYIRLKEEEEKAAAARQQQQQQPPPVSPPSQDTGSYGEVASPAAAAAPVAGFDMTAGTGMYLINNGNPPAAPSSLGTANNLNMQLLLGLNAYHGVVQSPQAMPAAAAAHPWMMGVQDQQASYDNLMTYPFVDNNFMWQSPFHANPNSGNRYYGGDAAGPSGVGRSGLDDVDAVQMASREFLMPSEDEVTLNLTRFM